MAIHPSEIKPCPRCGRSRVVRLSRRRAPGFTGLCHDCHNTLTFWCPQHGEVKESMRGLHFANLHKETP